MRTLANVPEKVRRGPLSVSIDGQTYEIAAFLADPLKENGCAYSADDIFDSFGDSNDKRRPSAFVNFDRSYLEELANVTPGATSIDNLIWLNPRDGRYWCIHQVAVRYAGWLNKRLQVVLDRAGIEWFKERQMRSLEWAEKRDRRARTVNLYGEMTKQLPTPNGKDDGYKYAIMNEAIQKPIQGCSTKSFKELNNVESAADAYSIAMLDADTLSRSVTVMNVQRKKINNLWDARDEAMSIATEIAGVVRKLATK